MRTTEIIKIIGLLIAGIVIGIFIFHSRSIDCETRFSWVNPSISCGAPAVIRKTSYRDTQIYLEEFIRQEQSRQTVDEVSVYFRDLEAGPVFGINELADFVPASLLKLPAVMAFLGEAETNSSILSERITYQTKYNTQNDVQNIHPDKTLQLNRSYTIKELLEYTVKYSDNVAYDLLENYQFTKRPGNLERVYLELGLLVPRDRFDAVIDVKRYASLFRILYNISYLNPTLSEVLLSWLSGSTFDDGIVAGVPKGIAVANKFGERGMPDSVTQLHDCGIVYYPNNPYLLCVMTRGKKGFQALSETIATISRTVYNAVDERRLTNR